MTEIRQTSQKWFDRLFVRTGIRESVYRYFIPTERERQLSKGFEKENGKFLPPPTSGKDYANKMLSVA